MTAGERVDRINVPCSFSLFRASKEEGDVSSGRKDDTMLDLCLWGSKRRWNGLFYAFFERYPALGVIVRDIRAILGTFVRFYWCYPLRCEGSLVRNMTRHW